MRYIATGRSRGCHIHELGSSFRAQLFSLFTVVALTLSTSKQIHTAYTDDRIGAGWLGTGRPDGRTSAFARDTKTQSETTTSLCSLRLQLSFSVLQKCYLLNTSSVCCCFILKCRVLRRARTDCSLAAHLLEEKRDVSSKVIPNKSACHFPIFCPLCMPLSWARGFVGWEDDFRLQWNESSL